MEIKSVIERLYEFNISSSQIEDGNEILATTSTDELLMLLGTRDLSKNLVVTPSGYEKGLVYKTSNSGELYNNPFWDPGIVKFNMNFYGLKPGSVYKITFIARDTGSVDSVTSDRTLQVVSSEKEELIKTDLSGQNDNTQSYKIFRATSSEFHVRISIGKIYLNNIILEEVELIEDAEVSFGPDENLTYIGEGKMSLVAYGIFALQYSNPDSEFRRKLLIRYRGRGVIMSHDTVTNTYILERDSVEDVIGASFVSVPFMIDANINKIENASGKFDTFITAEIGQSTSPGSIKDGYMRFAFTKKDSYVNMIGEKGFIYINIYKYN